MTRLLKEVPSKLYHIDVRTFIKIPSSLFTMSNSKAAVKKFCVCLHSISVKIAENCFQRT